MNLDIIEKHVHLTPLANGNIEVMFGGQPCLVVSESYDDGYTWKINPLFAKLTYGANIFEDVPYCYNSVDTVEEAIAEGLSSLNDLGAFHGVIDLPADTYAEEHLDEARADPLGAWIVHKDGKLVKKFKTRDGAKKFMQDKPDHKLNSAEGFYDKKFTTESEDLDEAVTHKELLAGAQKAYIDATRQGNGVMAKHYGAQILKHKANIAKQIAAAKQKNESEEQIDERADREDDEGYARTKNADDAHNEKIAFKKTYKPAPRKTPEQEKAEWDKWVKECITDDCRKEALKHSDSIMEAHDLAQGLLESIMDELNEIKADVVTTYDKEKTTNTAKTAAGKKSLYKQIAQSQKEPKFNQWKVKESVEDLDELNEISNEKKQEYLDKAVPTHQKQLLCRTAVPATKQQLDKRRASIQKVSKELTGKTHYQESVEELDEAALSGDAYWKAKEEAAKEAKAKEERASMGIKEPVKKGRGKPTNIDLEFVHAAAKKNLEAGKRPTTGMDRNEKIHFVRHLSKHPDFADHHVAKAGRPTGTTAVAKVEKEKVKKAETSAFSMWAGLGKK